ncbi:tetratricopeptide repeat protein [Alishewanella sp. d11]|uniref:tetratricopeptide repeat protein n=1 Tax=Alishewanella sp. d11 TaxID=3414030 RepID=UPI003BF90AA0
MKSVFFTLLLSFPAMAVVPTELQQLFERAQYQQLLQAIDAVDNAQQHPDLMLLQVRTLIQQHLREEANTLLNTLVLAYPEHSGILTQAALNKLVLANTGSVFNARKRANDALGLLLEAIRLEPTNFQAQQALISFYQTAPANVGGSEELARERVIELSKLDAVQGILAQVNIAVHEERANEALQILEQALTKDPDNTAFLIRKANLLTQQSAFLVAQQTYLKVLPLLTDPIQLQNTHFQIGRLAVFTGEYKVEGIAALEHYLAFFQDSQQPRLHRAKLRLAQLYLQQDQRAKAIALYSEIKNVENQDEDFIETLNQLGAQLAEE